MTLNRWSFQFPKELFAFPFLLLSSRFSSFFNLCACQSICLLWSLPQMTLMCGFLTHVRYIAGPACEPHKHSGELYSSNCCDLDDGINHFTAKSSLNFTASLTLTVTQASLSTVAGAIISHHHTTEHIRGCKICRKQTYFLSSQAELAHQVWTGGPKPPSGWLLFALSL